MSFNRSMFSSASPHWATPSAIYQELDDEFQFTCDPCPLRSLEENGLNIEWTGRVYVNPPYGRKIGAWIQKGYESAQATASVVVMLLPSRTDTKWWHDYIMKANEVRFIKGRLRFGNYPNGAPFPSCIVVFKR